MLDLSKYWTLIPGKRSYLRERKRGGFMRDAKIIVVDDNEAVLRSLRNDPVPRV